LNNTMYKSNSEKHHKTSLSSIHQHYLTPIVSSLGDCKLGEF
jgi:hypothetical protein